MKRILLTGAGQKGFIGRTLKERLAEKYDVFAPTRQELDLLNAEDVKDYAAANKIEAVVHSAVHVPNNHGHENEYLNDMKMFMNLERLGDEVEKIVYFGSGAEYDKRYDITMASEDMIGKSVPVSEYGFAKYTMNQFARQSKNIYNFRLFGVYGEYCPWQHNFVAALCCKAVHKLPLSIRQDCSFDFLDADDIAPAIDWALSSDPKHHDYNLCRGTPYMLSEIAAVVLDIAQFDEDIVFFKQGRDLDYTASVERLSGDMPDFRVTPLRESLGRLYEYYLENKHLVDYDTAKRIR